MVDAPVSGTLFAFNVGFGDCLLLRFSYAGGERRHVLIDFGSTRQPKERPGNYMARVARDIRDLCGGKLDVLVATHRHKDHISGFATNKSGSAPGNIIAGLEPDLVLQPWTEHPEAAVDATSAPKRANDMHFAKSLASMSRTAAALARMARNNADAGVLRMTEKERSYLSFIGENNVSNLKAVKNLLAMGRKSEARYLRAGDDPGTSEILPGVEVQVLGPPDITQHDTVRKQRARNRDEYWHLVATASRRAAGQDSDVLFPGHVRKTVPMWARWGCDRLRELRRQSLLSIAASMDRALNNTSLILLFTVGKTSMLFPGDAQWENWEFALSQPEIVEKLKNVDLYKVGHHGSLNATPKSLWSLFENRGTGRKRGRLTSVMSTMHGVHGHTKDTAVPRSTLVEALEKDTAFETTEDLKIDRTSETFYVEVPIAIR